MTNLLEIIALLLNQILGHLAVIVWPWLIWGSFGMLVVALAGATLISSIEDRFKRQKHPGQTSPSV